MELILYQPQIPQNAGNIARTCAVTGTTLVLINPLGFSLAERHLKRSGLDYWDMVNIKVESDLIAYLESTSAPFYFFSSKVKTPYSDIRFTPHDRLIFGSETQGLSPVFFERWPEKFFTIPMIDQARCLNLSNSAAIVLYEGLRQQNFFIDTSIERS